MKFFSRSTRRAIQPQDRSAGLEVESFGLFEFGPENQSENCAVDIVAVHGLGGHYRSTWEYQHSDGKTLWLEDFLIDQLRDANIAARVLSYGYDSAPVFTNTVTSIDNEAERLLNKLELKRDLEQEKKRPIIFVAHSLGGLIVKKSMILAWERSSLYGALLKSIRGIVFLGVPHRGADIPYWASLPANIIKYGSLGFGGSTDFLKSLEKNSESWRTISKQFVERGESLQIRTFFETKKIGNMLIVDEDSARLNLPNERAMGLSDSDHRTICKFSNVNSQRYKPVWMGVRDLAREVTARSSPSLYKPSEQELNCLRDLYTSDYERHKNRNAERTPGTCEWVFVHPEYLKWESNNTSSLLWISADPGCGKSVLASFLVDKFKSSESQEVLPSTICFFFFKDDSDEQDNAISAMSSILHQLLSTTPELIQGTLEQYKIKGKKLFGELRSLWNIFTSTATDPTSKRVVCVIDGLDECQNPSRDELLQLLGQFCTKSTTQGEKGTQLKILVLSRPYSYIEDALHRPLTVRMKMEDESGLTGADVKMLIRHKVKTFGSNRNIPDQVQERLINRLISYAGQTFLWVSLVLADLEPSLRASETKLMELISQIPTNLNAMYEKILGRSQKLEDARRVLYIIVGAARPLSLEEMNIAFVIKPEDRDHDHLDLEPAIETTIRNLCGLFVKVIDSKVYLVHQTAREFLINVNRARVQHLNTWQNSLDTFEADNILAQICISYLMFEVFGQQHLFRSLHFWRDHHIINQTLKEYQFLEYAATNWASHFCKVENRTTNIVVESVINICNSRAKRFQNWCALFNKSTDRPVFKPFPESTPLHIASFFGWETIVNLLLKRGADINARDHWGKTSMMLAIEMKYDAVTKLLIENGADLEAKTPQGGMVLHLMAESGNESIVKLLLKNGANPNARNSNGQTALHRATEHGREAMTRVLIKMGADVNLVDNYGETALILAAREGHESIVKLLLENGASPNIQSKHDEDTAMHLAAQNGLESTVKVLIEYGARHDFQNIVGHTALHLAAINGHESTVKMLFENGAIPDVQNLDADTAMHFAARYGHESTVKLLLENGAVPDVQNSRGYTAMYLTAAKGHGSIIKLLIENGASLNVQDKREEKIALHAAAWNGHEPVVKILLENGAVPDVQNQYGNTAMHLATADGHESIIKIL